jgi:hypothetical protein
LCHSFPLLSSSPSVWRLAWFGDVFSVSCTGESPWGIVHLRLTPSSLLCFAPLPESSFGQVRTLWSCRLRFSAHQAFLPLSTPVRLLQFPHIICNLLCFAPSPLPPSFYPCISPTPPPLRLFFQARLLCTRRKEWLFLTRLASNTGASLLTRVGTFTPSQS